MALTAAQNTTVFEILGVPQGSHGAVFNAIINEKAGPGYAQPYSGKTDLFNFAPLISEIDFRLGSLTVAQEARVVPLLTRWDVMTSSSVLRVDSSKETRGRLADYETERIRVRIALGNIIGLSVPSGGFMAEASRMNRQGVTR